MKKDEALPGRFFKADEFRDRPELTVTISHIVAKENIGTEADPQTAPVLYFEGHEQGFILKSQAWDSVVEATGEDDSDHWPGKRVTIYRDPSVTFGGKKVGGVRVKKPGGSGTAPQGGGGSPRPAAGSTLSMEAVKRLNDLAASDGFEIGALGDWLLDVAGFNIPSADIPSTWPKECVGRVKEGVAALKAGWEPAPAGHKPLSDIDLPF